MSRDKHEASMHSNVLRFTALHLSGTVMIRAGLAKQALQILWVFVLAQVQHPLRTLM